MAGDAVPGGGRGVTFYLFARFQARAGMEDAVMAAMNAIMAPSRAEPGCLEIGAYRSLRDPRLFFVHSRWTDEIAFDRHAALPHTLRFIAEMERLTDAMEVSRSERLA